MASTPEGTVKKKIKAFLRELDECFFFSPVGGPFATHGIPDIIVCLKGRFIGIECKRPGNEYGVTANQQSVLEQMTEAGALAFIASSVEVVKTQLYLAGLYIP